MSMQNGAPHRRQAIHAALGLAAAFGIGAIAETEMSEAQAATLPNQQAGPGWDDPNDVQLVQREFDGWAAAVIAKDQETATDYHDELFGVLVGGVMLNKAQHVVLQMTVENREMRLVEIRSTRRIGDLILVWSTHFIRADAVPPIPSIGLEGDWGGEAAARVGFVQKEFTVWRQYGAKLKCVSFMAVRVG